MKYIIRFSLIIIIFSATFFSCSTKHDTTEINLAGEWSVTLENTGQNRNIVLPSTLDMAGLGIETDTITMTTDEKFRRLTRRHSYIGPAKYKKEIEITPEMANKPLELSLERVIWKSTARLGDKEFDNNGTSLVTPHKLYLREGMPEGRYDLEITIDNSKQYDISYDNLAHAYTNDTQTMWNGILGNMSLKALNDYEIEWVEIYPKASLDSVMVVTSILNNTSQNSSKELTYTISGADILEKLQKNISPGENKIEIMLPTAGLKKWNEFSPALYKLNLAIDNNEKYSTNFGLRTVDNQQGLRINGTPVYLRGTLECCIFPLTGTPPLEKEGWLKTFDTARSFGLNHLRFHSWCPPEAAFEVADSLGFYLQVELPVWSLKIGDDEKAENYLRDEFENIVRNYGNHPSLVLISVGNELQHDFNWLNETVARMKERDSRHLYTTTSFTFEKGHGGHPEPEDEFFITQWTDDGWVRGQGVFETEPPAFNKNYSEAVKNVQIPLITHEIGQYAIYPNLQEIDKYNGILNPLNFKHIRNDLQNKKLLEKSHDMTMASGKLAAILYKEEIERNMKTPGISGFQLLGLQDFSGQGTALVGLVDAFWDNKGIVTEEWFRNFNSPVVPLLNFEKAVYKNEESFVAEPLLANYSDKDIENVEIELTLSIEEDKLPFASEKIKLDKVSAGTVYTYDGKLTLPLDSITFPSIVNVSLTTSIGQRNEWKVFVYPEMQIDYGNVFVTRSFEEAIKALEVGKTVLLSPDPKEIEGLESKFLPVFWSPVHFPKQAGTMGIMNDASHPALKYFPNEGHTDWQWWEPVHNAKVIVTDNIEGVTPIVEVIDNFVNNRKLSYIFETKAGNGNLLFSSIDLLDENNKSPEMQALKYSLFEYMKDESLFNPQEETKIKDIINLKSTSDSQVKTNAISIYD